MDAGSLNKESILDAAEQVIRRFGPQKANISDVARMVNVSHAAIYRYYENKTALWNAVMQRWLDRISESLELIVHKELPVEQKLRTWLESLMQAKRESALSDPEMFAKYVIICETSREIQGNHLIPLHNQLTTIILEGIENGTFATSDADKSASAIFAATSLFHSPRLASEWKDPQIDQRFDDVFELLCNGLKYRA